MRTTLVMVEVMDMWVYPEQYPKLLYANNSNYSITAINVNIYEYHEYVYVYVMYMYICVYVFNYNGVCNRICISNCI